MSAALVAAAPRPAAKPAPTPTPTAAPTSAPQPVLPIVIVYPFQVSTDLQADSGARAAQLFVAQINSSGGVDAIAAPSTVGRDKYWQYALSLSADYYITGYMTPLAGGVSLIEQLVSTSTGTIIYGATAQIQSFEDAAAQAVAIHDDIVAREQSMHTAFAQAEAQATPAPAATNQANISGGIASIFRRRGRQTAGSRTAVVKPSKGIFVAQVSGTAPSEQRAAATNALVRALDQAYVVHASGASGNIAKQADAICGTARNNTVGTGALSSASVRRGFFSKTQYTFVFDVYTCFGAKLAETSGRGDSISAAVNAAVSAYAADHPNNG